ncbi:PIN domain-containing protein [uncultured Mycobacterium sp.]|uniref:PIN domain-containing protein n=1 Tax=uncultured Mycobacterium sp. TaxID=171292 RepID=UPI0035C9E21E
MPRAPGGADRYRITARATTLGHFRFAVHRSRGEANTVPDAYHAALAIENGATWITTDRAFARFPGLRWRGPFD